MNRTIIGTQRAYITANSHGTVQEAIENNDITVLSFTDCNMDNYPGWTYVGKVSVVVEIEVSDDEIVAGHLNSLNKIIDQINLEAGEKIAKVKEQISKLTSIAYTAPIDSNIIEA